MTTRQAFHVFLLRLILPGYYLLFLFGICQDMASSPSWTRIQSPLARSNPPLWYDSIDTLPQEPCNQGYHLYPNSYLISGFSQYPDPWLWHTHPYPTLSFQALYRDGLYCYYVGIRGRSICRLWKTASNSH